MGVLLYYDIVIDNIILVALVDIATEQFRATLTTIEKINQLLDYLVSNPHTAIQYYASGMIMFIHSDASYFSISKSRSCASSVFLLSDTKHDPLTFSEYIPVLNRLIFVLWKLLRNIVAYAAKAKYGSLFLNGQEALPT